MNSESSGGRGRAPDYEALVDSVNGIVWEGDARTLTFSFVSGQAERILGYSAKRWVEEPDFWVEHIHPDDRHRVVSTCARDSADGRDHALEYRMIAADGRVVWLRDNVTVVIEAGEPVTCRGVMIEVGDRREEVDALHRAHEQLRAVVANAPVSLFTLDRDGIMTFCDGGSLRRSPFDIQSIIGRSIEDILPNRAEFEAIRADLRRALAGESFNSQHELMGLIAETRFTALRDPDGSVAGIVGLGVDVTRRVQAEREQQALQAQLLHAQKLESLGVLAGGIAHDFNNLLMTILGSSDLALSDLPHQGTQRADVERIRAAARTGAALTDQLLAYAGRRPLEVRRLGLSTLISEMAELLNVSVSKKADLQLDLAPDLPALEGDTAQLHQVILNLVVNGSDALGGEAGRVVLRTVLRTPDRDELTTTYLLGSLEVGRRYVVLEVSDTGCGMDEETRVRIFDPFFTTKVAGRGLGLAAVLGIVRAHHGAVSVYSEPGEGSVFRVFFPATEAAAPQRALADTAIANWRGDGTILVVDDEPAVLEVACDMAERLGFDVLSATDGAEAQRVFAAHADEIRAVLLDMTMPETSGPEAAKILRSIRPGLPVVLMSGYSEEHISNVLAEGVADAFVQKPFEREELAVILRELLESD